MNIPPNPLRQLTPEEAQTIRELQKNMTEMDKFKIYTIKDGKVVQVNEIKDRFVEMEFANLIPSNAFELEDEELLPPDEVNELANKKLYGKNEIMLLLGCGDQKALNFLKLLFQMKYAIKVGKSYLIKSEDFDRFFDDFKGQEIVI